MENLNPRIKTALISIHPTSRNPAWHGCPTALGVLRGVSPAIALWRPYLGANNIREIALHIAFWENSVANRLGAQKAVVGVKQRKTGWALMLDTVNEKQWKSELELIKATHKRLAEALARFDPALLDRPLVSGSKRSAAEVIHGVAEHTLYHTAQMEMLKTLAKQQGIGERTGDRGRK
jgi:DinB superfamily